MGLTVGKYLIKIIFDIKEQLIIGYRPMNFNISTNYFKNIRLGYYFL